MAPKVLGLGIPHTSPFVPADRASALQKSLEAMEADMNASQFEWEIFYTDVQDDFSLVVEKLREKEWDVVMVGMGLRTGPPLIGLFEKIVNAVHRECPGAKFAFNTSFEHTSDDVQRAWDLKV